MTSKNISLDELHVRAIQARTHAHAPYSNHKVGAALRLSTGEVFSGCNVENASYGGTVCGERVAVWKSVSEKGTVQIEDVVVVTDAETAWPPCGFCRQVIAEFSYPGTMIHLANLAGIQRSLKFDELFPDSFRPAYLTKK
jgi:cytidine deaminase